MQTISLPCPMCPHAQIEQGMFACPNCGWEVTEEFTMRLISRARDTHMRQAPGPATGVHTGSSPFGSAPTANPNPGFGSGAPPPGFGTAAPPPGGGTGFRGSPNAAAGGPALPGGIVPGLGDQPITQMRQRQQSTARLRVTAETESKIKRAVVVMVILSALFAIGGYLEITQVQKEAEAARATIDSMIADGTIPDNIAAEEHTRISFIVSIVMAVDIGMVVAFLGLAVWTRYQPLPPTILALLLYGGALAAQYHFIGPEVLAKGVILKILIVAALISGVGAAVDYTRAKSSYKRELARAQFN